MNQATVLQKTEQELTSVKQLYIYVYQNKINGKIYIGQTNDLSFRDLHHVKGYNIKRNSIIDAAISKYGRDNFELWVVKIVSTQEEADQEEIYWIAEMREKLGTNNVYNISNGGHCGGMTGRKHTEKTKEKIRQARAKQIIIITEETKKKISKAHIGMTYSEERNKKVSKSKIGSHWILVNGKRIYS